MGTFDPFTIGHASVVRRALPLFDRLVIGVVGDNVHKPGMQPAEERLQAIRRLYQDEPAIEVKSYFGLAMDFARQNVYFKRLGEMFGDLRAIKKELERMKKEKEE